MAPYGCQKLSLREAAAARTSNATIAMSPKTTILRSCSVKVATDQTTQRAPKQKQDETAPHVPYAATPPFHLVRRQ
jgi:hypothetical protein